MGVVLTGDVHHFINSSDQRFTRYSEAALAVEYARIAARYGLKVTLFFTGRAVLENGADAEGLLSMGHVEIGGHGWDAFRPRWWYGLLNRLMGSPYGFPWFQRRLILRTRTVIEEYTGRTVRSWRNHAFRYDRYTPALLAEAGIAVWSDEVNLERYAPYCHPDGIVVLPINTLPDHEHLYHGMRTPELVTVEGRGPSYPPDLWCDKVKAQVEAVIRAGGIATVLAHPICMKIADDWATFRQLCSYLSRYDSLLAMEVAPEGEEKGYVR